MYYVYILQCKDKTLYTGITTDLKRRVEEHNSSKLGAKYTTGRRPVKLVYSHYFKNRSRAGKEETRIKKMTREEKIILIKSDNSLPKILKSGIIGNMKMQIEINNLSGCPVGKDFFVDILEETLSISGYDFLQKKKISLSLALVSPEEIKKLNKAYRKKDAVTDVLSFCEYNNRASLEKVVEKELFLGELVLCYNDIRDYALKNKKDFSKELAKVASHGLLHLLGFSHGSKMFRLQENVAQSIKKSRTKK